MWRGILLLGIFLSGCSTLEEMRWRGAPEGPTSWRAGFVDGCMSGRQDARGVKHPDVDKERFRADDQYRAGWQQGRDECFAREQVALSATPTPTETSIPYVSTPPPAVVAAPPPAVVVTPAPAVAVAPGARRIELERRIAELKRELGSLEAELKQLP